MKRVIIVARMKKSVLVVCQYYYPEIFQITSICEQLAKDGYGVTVLTGLPNYPFGIIPDEYKTGHRNECLNGVHIIRCWEFPRRKSAWGLSLNYLSFLFSATIKAIGLSRFDCVLVYQLSPVLMGIPAILYAKRNHVPLILYCCDLWPASVAMYIKNEAHPVYRIADWISKIVYRSCDRILLQSNSFAEYLQEEHTIARDKMSYLPAFSDESYLMENFTTQDDTVDFVFLGNLGVAQNLLAVLEAVRLIRHIHGFQVHFVGEGSCLQDLQQFVKQHDLEGIVKFYGYRPLDEMPKFYKLADACLVSLVNTSAIGRTMPSKVQGYMAAGKPILGMIDGDVADVVEKADCGRCVSAGDVEGFAALMRDFIVHPDCYRGCGNNGREYFKQHFRQTVFMDRLEHEIELLKG